MTTPTEKTSLSPMAGIEKHSEQSPPAKIETMHDCNGDFASENCFPDEDFLCESRRMADPYYLPTVSLTELYQRTYPSCPAIIEGLLYGGVYILAGAPKIGKSYLVAQIAYHVSLGLNLWGVEVKEGTVLYMALENDLPRLQRRMFEMYGTNDSANLHFSTVASQIDYGLNEQLEFFLQAHMETNLIIIDTLQKIRDAGGKAYSYATDYDIIGKLKQLADKYKICVLVVHHTRKQPAGDVFETISGTTGLLGCADGALIMTKEKRTALEATIAVVGRDQRDQILYLTQDPETPIWNFVKTETELFKEPLDPILEAVASLVTPEQPTWTGSPSDLVTVLNLEMLPNVLTKHLNVKCGKLMDDYGILYTNKAKHVGRTITLTLLPSEETP